ncbi:MAG: hypothetical protein WDN46_00430 [Methylocella sp.]
MKALKRVPPEALLPGEKEMIEESNRPSIANIALMNFPRPPCGSIEYWASGYEDTLRTLRHPEWLRRSSLERGVRVHDLHREDPT